MLNKNVTKLLQENRVADEFSYKYSENKNVGLF
jgi:hypothetical protein